MTAKKHWLANPVKETLVILAPAILPVIIVMVFSDYFSSHQEVTSWWWLVLVLIVDVGHVYSTLFRFYWERNTFIKYRPLLVAVPLVSFTVGSMLHLYDPDLFWRALAYAAVYHFVRQQYGFMRIYSRHEQRPAISRTIDKIAIYNATLYPLLYWHFHLTDSLSWFVPHDFVRLPFADWTYIFEVVFYGIFASYAAKEIYFSIKERDLNVPKGAVVLGTYLSWYAGIVIFRGDLTFTLLNVVAHGVPYMGLVWIYGERKSAVPFPFTIRGVAIFGGVLVALAYIEELLWDVLVWKDHPMLFPFFVSSEALSNHLLLSFVVPLLVLPQITHYVLDGFIWRFSREATARA